MMHAVAHGKGSSGPKPHCSGFQNHRSGGHSNEAVGMGILTTRTKTTNDRFVGNSATLPSVVGSVLTRVTMALRRWRMRQQLLILLIWPGMLTMPPLITLLVILTSSP
jgi:hypothetical protein